MLSVKNLSFQYKKSNPVLSDVSFKAPLGQCTAVLGNNGAGKTSLIKCIARILKPQSGKILIEDTGGGKNILDFSQKEMAKNIAYLSQESPTGETLVYDAVMLGRLPYIKWGSTNEDREIVLDAISQLGLSKLSHRRCDTLSGGERQKVALARSLAQRANILLLDEPTSSLDLKNQYEVLQTISEICKKNNIAVLMVIHDINLSLRFCTNFVLLKDNKIFAAGGKEIINSKNLSEVYGFPVSACDLGDEKIILPSALA